MKKMPIKHNHLSQLNWCQKKHHVNIFHCLWIREAYYLVDFPPYPFKRKSFYKKNLAEMRGTPPRPLQRIAENCYIIVQKRAKTSLFGPKNCCLAEFFPSKIMGTITPLNEKYPLSSIWRPPQCPVKNYMIPEANKCKCAFRFIWNLISKKGKYKIN